MPTPRAAAPTKASSAGYIIDVAHQAGNQMLNLYRHGVEMSTDAAFTWAETVIRFSPVKRPPTAARESFTKLTDAIFDLSERALKTQRELLDATLAKLKEPVAA